MLYLDRLGGRIKRGAMRDVREAEWFGEHWKQLAPRPKVEVAGSLAERIAAAKEASDELPGDAAEEL